MSNAHFSQFGKFIADPCDPRVCCCNPETTTTTPFTMEMQMQKDYRPGCGPCCRKSSVTVTLTGKTQTGDAARRIIVNPAEVGQQHVGEAKDDHDGRHPTALAAQWSQQRDAT